VNTVAVDMELAHVNPEVVTAHLPRDEVRVNPLPEVAAVKVAQVWVLHVPYESRHPVVVPVDRSTVMVDFVGTDVGTYNVIQVVLVRIRDTWFKEGLLTDVAVVVAVPVCK